jgi:glucose-6-phosphate dehydrogenase assembly protein OpcA
MADRLVIDSASFDRPHEDLRQLAGLLAGGRLRLSDLNWGRLTSWRELVAGFWDVADYRDSLKRIEKIVIEYDPPDRSHEEMAPKALLALGWITASLGWEVSDGGATFDDGRARFILKEGGREIEAVLAATDDVAGRDGWLTSLTISTTAGDEFFVELLLEEGRLRTGARLRGAGHACERVLGYEARTEGERLSAELDILSRDEVYESAVAAAARLLAALGA